MSTDFERLRASGAKPKRPLSDSEAKALEFVASQGSLDDLTDEHLERHVAALGGMTAFAESRAIIHNHPWEMVLEELRRQFVEQPGEALLPMSEAMREVCCRVLGIAGSSLSSDEEFALDKLFSRSHRIFVREVAGKQIEAPRPAGSLTTVRAADETSVQMSKEEPRWVLNREEMLTLQEQDRPASALAYELSEFGACSPDRIAAILQSEFSEQWDGDRVFSEVEMVRVLCYGASDVD
jgi:hypothetical protein